jgi:hypothetical protein
MSEASSTHGTDENYTKEFYSANLKEEDYYLEDLATDGRIILTWILNEQYARKGTGCIWLSMATSDGLF